MLHCSCLTLDLTDPTIGAPGSGKGAVGAKLAKATGGQHLSVGDLLRKKQQEGSLDARASACLAANELMPQDVLFPVIEGELSTLRGSGVKVVLLDGFPRELDQGKAFNAEVGDSKQAYRWPWFFCIAREMAKLTWSIFAVGARIRPRSGA